MRVEVEVNQVVEAEVSIEDLMNEMRALPTSKSQPAYMNALNIAYGVLKRIPDEAIKAMTPAQLQLVITALNEQIKRYSAVTGDSGG